MIRKILILFCLVAGLNAAYLEELKWKKGESFLSFLEANNIPLSLYYDLDREDQEIAAEIRSNIIFQILRGKDDTIEQVLIPVNDELQIHIIKDMQTNNYHLQMTPIIYQEESLSLALDIQKSPYQDIVNATNNYALANQFVSSYKKSVNFKALQKGDHLVIFYSQKRRLGKVFSDPIIDAAMIEVDGDKNFIFLYDGSAYYNDKGKELAGYFLKMPITNYKRISSKFTRKRWHPILKRYRAHLGIDYAAKIGTPVKSAGNGRVNFVGKKGGYGNTIEIVHADGYKTLYAHLRGYKKGISKGRKVSRGQVIGYVGNTGLSTGPHLHFGLYKNNRAINPAKVVKVTKSKLSKKKMKKFMAHVDGYKKRFELALKERKNPQKEKHFDYIVSLRKHQKSILK